MNICILRNNQYIKQELVYDKDKDEYVSKIDFLAGDQFYFEYNDERYGQGDDVPVDLSNSTLPYTATTPTYSTQYVNYLKKDGQDVSLKLPLPKQYIIRFCVKKINGILKYFYCIDRKISFTSISGDSLDDGNMAIRSFSEWHAVKKPDNVNIYIASYISKGNVTLTKVNLDYIPARTGVILTTSNSTLSIPFETYTTDPEKELPKEYFNYLVPQIYNKNIMPKEDEYYNYIFYIIENTLGFYRPISQGVSSGRNFSYIALKQEILPKINSMTEMQAKEIYYSKNFVDNLGEGLISGFTYNPVTFIP